MAESLPPQKIPLIFYRTSVGSEARPGVAKGLPEIERQPKDGRVPRQRAQALGEGEAA